MTTTEIADRLGRHIQRCFKCEVGKVPYRGCRKGRVLHDAYHGQWLIERGREPNRRVWAKRKDGTFAITGQRIDPTELLKLIAPKAGR